MQLDWSDGDFVFLNSTCYSPLLMSALSVKAEALRSGALVVSLTKALQSEKFQLLSKKKYVMSWGMLFLGKGLWKTAAIDDVHASAHASSSTH